MKVPSKPPTMAMTPAEMGQKGGSVSGGRKAQSSRANAAKARLKKLEYRLNPARRPQ